MTDTDQEFIRRRDALALNVPGPVPDWFVHVPTPNKPDAPEQPPEPGTPPDFVAFLRDHGKKAAEVALEEWHEKKRKYAHGLQQWCKYRQAVADWEIRDHLFRIAQWKWAVADAMIVADASKPPRFYAQLKNDDWLKNEVLAQKNVTIRQDRDGPVRIWGDDEVAQKPVTDAAIGELRQQAERLKRWITQMEQEIAAVQLTS